MDQSSQEIHKPGEEREEWDRHDVTQQMDEEYLGSGVDDGALINVCQVSSWC